MSNLDIDDMLDAIRNNNAQKVREFIEAGINVNEPLEDNDTFLIRAASRGFLDIIKLLVEAGADVNIISQEGDNALSMVAQSGCQELFDYLLPLTSPEIREWAMKEALFNARRDKASEIVHMLSRAGANLNVQDDYNGGTPLMGAVLMRNLPFVKALIEKGADVNIANHEGKTALVFAAIFYDRYDLYDRDDEDEDIESILTKVGDTHVELIHLLFNAGAQLNSKDMQGRTALSHAAELGSHQAVELLIKLGADVNAQDEQGKTALIYAKTISEARPQKQKRRSQIIQILQNNGATEDFTN